MPQSPRSWHSVNEGWEVTGPLKVRMGLHTCEAEVRDGDYYGSAVNRAARLMSVAHGGQVVVSAATSELVRGGAVELVDLGEHRLRDLGEAERVFQIAHPELEREFPALLSVDELVGNLPVQPNRFVGRAASIEQITGLVGDTAVVTLTGPGGVGKTRLGVQVAAVLQPEFADGAWLVDLAPVNTAERVAAVVLETLGYKLAAGEDDVDGLVRAVARRRLLLVLDNCEHLVASVATVVDAISTSAPDVRVDRDEPGGSRGSGRTGRAGDAAARPTPTATRSSCSSTRARAARPDFALDAATTPTVVELCRRLDGIPLAIELAAARTRSIAPAKILERLDERFRMLTGGSRTAVGAPPDAAGRGRLVLRAAVRRREHGARSPVGVRGRLHPRRGRSGRRRRRDRRVRRAGACERAGRQVARRRRSRRGDVPAVGDDPPVRGRPVGRVGNRRARCVPATPTTTGAWPPRSRRSSRGRATSPPSNASRPTSRTCA